jgi:anti-anti-sigma factor
MNFELNHARIGPVAVLGLRGVYRPEDAQAFRECYQSYLETDFKWFLLDLHELAYISSAGLRSILELQKMLLAQGGQLRLVRPASFILDIFTTTHLDEVLDFHDTAPLAIYPWILHEVGKSEPPNQQGH